MKIFQTSLITTEKKSKHRFNVEQIMRNGKISQLPRQKRARKVSSHALLVGTFIGMGLCKAVWQSMMTI